MSKPLEVCYGLAGSDTAAVAALRTRLQDRVAAEGGSVEVISERPGAELAMTISQGQLAPGPRLLIVTDAGRYKTREAKKIAAALANAAPGTVVCLIADGELPGPLAEAAAAHGGLVARDTDEDPRRQVAAAAKRAGVTLAADAVEAVAAVDNLEPRRLASELDKLAVWADGQPADADAVALVCVFPQVTTEPWGLLSAVSERDGRRGVVELAALWRSGEQPARLAGLIKGRLRRLSQTRALLDRGAGPQTVARVTDSKPFAARKLIAAAKGWTLAELAEASARMEACERDIFIVGNGPAGRLLMERAVPAICVRRRR